MANKVRTYSFDLASAATNSGTQFVGNHSRLYMYVSNVTSWNAAAGNTTIQVRGAHASGTSAVAILSALVSTETVGGIYQISQAGVPYVSVGVNTATTSNGTIVLMVCNDD